MLLQSLFEMFNIDTIPIPSDAVITGLLDRRGAQVNLLFDKPAPINRNDINVM